MESNTNSLPNKKDVNVTFSKMLRAGVTISAIIISSGLALFLITGESGYPGESYPYTVKDLFSGLLDLKSYAIILFGLLCLLLTPIFRVVLSIYIFWKEKDYIYVTITSLVLLLLLLGMLLGKI